MLPAPEAGDFVELILIYVRDISDELQGERKTEAYLNLMETNII
jgi:hypothetical protein